MTKIILGLFIFSLSLSVSAETTLLLRANVPTTFRIQTTWNNSSGRPEATILSNDQVIHKRPKLIIERKKDQYKIIVVQS